MARAELQTRGRIAFDEMMIHRAERGLPVHQWDHIGHEMRLGWECVAQRIVATVTVVECQMNSMSNKVAVTKSAQPRKEPDHNKLMERITDKVPVTSSGFEFGDDTDGECD